MIVSNITYINLISTENTIFEVLLVTFTPFFWRSQTINKININITSLCKCVENILKIPSAISNFVVMNALS